MNLNPVIVVALIASPTIPISSCFAQCTGVPGQVHGLSLRLPWLDGGTHTVTQSYCGGAGGSHNGYEVDFGQMPPGTPIVAVADGTVIQVGDNTTNCWPNSCGSALLDGGVFVKIQHTATTGVRYNSAYLHLSQRVVGCGSAVQQGQIIGYSGNSGHSSAPHLHFHMRRANPSVCPIPSEIENVRPVPMEGRQVGTLGCRILEFVTGQSYTTPWVAVSLHPIGATGLSAAHDVRHDQQVGEVRIGTYHNAALWSGTAGSWVNLSPAGSTFSQAVGVDSGQQVGSATIGGVQQAGRWTGSAASWVSLHPAGASSSTARGVSGNVQVGWVQFPGSSNRAAKWTGTAGSWTSLHPAGASSSVAYDLDGLQVVGQVDIHAALWPNGSSSAWTDLNPANAIVSYAVDVQGGEQVGTVVLDTQGRAALWRGSAASWIDLHPAGAISSGATAVYGGQQVGFADIHGVWQRAGLWRGTAASWVDLHASLPSTFEDSTASGIWEGAWQGHPATFVVGWGMNTLTNRVEALLWIGPPPCGGTTSPACYANCDESTTAPILNINDFTCFLNKFASGDTYANCDSSTTPPVLNIQDFVCFLNQFAAGCSQ